jgi:hypothetical protein
MHWQTKMQDQPHPENGQGISSLHTGSRFPRRPSGASAAFVDGSVRFLSETLSPEQLQALLTTSRNEPIDP